MGANAKRFLEIMDIEVNGGEDYIPSVKPKYRFIDGTFYKTKNGDIIKEVGSRGRIRYCVYPNSEKSYTFWKSDIELIYMEDEKLKASKLFKYGM